MKKENLRSNYIVKKGYDIYYTHTKPSRMIKNHEQIPAVNTLIEIKYTTHSK